MFCNLVEFVNRQTELDLYQALLTSPMQRILVVCGESGMGKSCLLQRFQQERVEPQRVLGFLDFRTDPTLAQVVGVLRSLRQQWRGEFDRKLADVEKRLSQEFQGSNGRGTIAMHLGQALAQPLHPISGNLTISGSVQAENIVLGSNIVINNSSLVLNPSYGAHLIEAELAFQRNNAFREALIDLLATRSVLLMIDHYDSANESVKQWLDKNLFALATDCTPTFTNLRFVIACQKSPFEYQSLFSDGQCLIQKLQPFPYEVVELFWVGKRGLDKRYAQVMAKASAGHPGTLLLMANNYARA